jgi:glycine hydroxymethyltransferase
VCEILASHRSEVDEGSVVLYAGTNAPSPLARRFLGSGMETRPSMGYPGDKYQTYTERIEELEFVVTDLARRAFGASFAEVRIQSGTLANLAVYAAFARPGEKIAVLPEGGGGHISHHAYGAPGVRGLEVVEMPYDAGRMNLDLERLPSFLAMHKPKLVVLGASLLLFPHPIGDVRASADEIGARVVYDAAHVDGLVAGGLFQRPLEEGAHLVTSSTYKSLGGPSGGIILTDDAGLAERVATTVYPGMTANYDAGRLGALAVTLAEALEFGEAYARACVDNARELGGCLHEEGFEVAGAEMGYTASHHVALDAALFGGGEEASRRLGRAGIHASGIGLPWQGPEEPYRGIRLGTQEVTRRGMGPEHMRRIANLMAAVLLHGEDPAAVRREVREFRGGFSSFRYCFPEEVADGV